MATFLSSASNSISSLSNLVVVNPQQNSGYEEQASPTPPGSTTPNLSGKKYLFHVEADNTIELQSDITDSYIETNSARNDHIALKPERVTVQGFIGELNDVLPIDLKGYDANFIASKLTALGAYEPKLSVAALIALNSIVLGYQIVANAAKSVGQTLSSLGILDEYVTNQAYYFGLFYSAWQQRTLYTIQTPWTKFNDMAIEALRAKQDATTRMITDFEVTFKKLRFIDTSRAVTKYRDTLKDGQLGAQSSQQQNAGENTLQQSDTTVNGVVGNITGQ